jgi:hypothetical protein
MMFMSFSTAMMQGRIDNFMAVGINPNSHEWDVLGKRLQSKGPYVIAGDFSGYDSRQLSIVLMAICDMINDWYNDSEEMKLIRLTLFQEVINSIHISGDTVYQWSSKLPSGHPLTTILNSLQAIILLMLCWCDLHPRGKLALEEFWSEVYPCAFGDDNIFNVSTVATAWYNLTTITEAMVRFNQIYTDENKTLNAAPYKRLSECTFLKRAFRYDNRLRRLVAPLELDSILDMLNWYTDGPERMTNQITNVENALRELSLHSPEVFEEWVHKICEASAKYLNYVPPTIQYTVLQDQAIGRELAW